MIDESQPKSTPAPLPPVINSFKPESAWKRFALPKDAFKSILNMQAPSTEDFALRMKNFNFKDYFAKLAAEWKSNPSNLTFSAFLKTLTTINQDLFIIAGCRIPQEPNSTPLTSPPDEKK